MINNDEEFKFYEWDDLKREMVRIENPTEETVSLLQQALKKTKEIKGQESVEHES